MVAEEIARANESIRARDLVAPEIDALQSQLDQERARTAALTQQMIELEAGVRHSNRSLEEAQAQLERERCGHLRHVRASVSLMVTHSFVLNPEGDDVRVTGDAERAAATNDQEAQ